MNRLAAFFYLATLALIPWGGLITFPWLHENAQWSDVLFAVAALAWVAGVVASRRWPTLRPVHAALGLYLGWAALSLLVADPRPASGPTKLLGVAMLVALMVVTSEMARQPGMPRAIGYTVAITSLLTAGRGDRGRGPLRHRPHHPPRRHLRRPPARPPHPRPGRLLPPQPPRELLHLRVRRRGLAERTASRTGCRQDRPGRPDRHRHPRLLPRPPRLRPRRRHPRRHHPRPPHTR